MIESEGDQVKDHSSSLLLKNFLVLPQKDTYTEKGRLPAFNSESIPKCKFSENSTDDNQVWRSVYKFTNVWNVALFVTKLLIGNLTI